MKTFSRVIALFASMAILITLFSGIAFAKIIQDEKIVTMEVGEVLDDDLFVASEEVTLNGTVNGNVYAAGGIVMIGGLVDGNVYTAGGQVQISGEVRGDVVVGAGEVTFDNAEVLGSVISGAGTISVDSDSRIRGGMIFGAGVLDMAAKVTNSLIGGAGLVKISGEVGKSSYIGGDEIRLESGAVMREDFTYYSERELLMSDGATVGGDLIFESHAKPQFELNFSALKSGFLIWSYLGMLIVGLLMLHFFPKPLSSVNKAVAVRPWMSLFLGLAVLILAPILVVIFIASIVGVPLGFLLLTFYILEIVLAKIYMGYFLGENFAQLIKWKKPNQYTVFALGLLFVYLLKFIPFLGPLLLTITFLFVFGGMATMKNDYLDRFKSGKV